MQEHKERRVRDLVCGMEIDPAETAWRHTHEGETYYFCHPRCLGKFRANPTLYLQAARISRAGEPTSRS
jgi:Cu+-exporting ATPase